MVMQSAVSLGDRTKVHVSLPEQLPKGCSNDCQATGTQPFSRGNQAAASSALSGSTPCANRSSPVLHPMLTRSRRYSRPAPRHFDWPRALTAAPGLLKFNL